MNTVSRDLRIRERFKAWWHGYDVAPLSQAGAVENHPEEAAQPEARRHPLPGARREWTRERIYVAQLVFGTGSHGPGIAARTTDMIAPLALTPEGTALELGTGLGLGAHTVARITGAWIDGLEPDRALAEAGHRLCVGAPGSDKVTISSVSPEDPSIQRHRRDAVICREALHRFARPEETLKHAYDLMKPTAQLVLSEFVAPDNVDKKQLGGWVELNPYPLHLWHSSELRGLLQQAGFQVHAVHDDSEEFVSDLMRTLQAFSSRLNQAPLPEHWREWVMVEVEYWARLVAMLEAGRLRLQRITASPLAPTLS